MQSLESLLMTWDAQAHAMENFGTDHTDHRRKEKVLTDARAIVTELDTDLRALAQRPFMLNGAIDKPKQEAAIRDVEAKAQAKLKPLVEIRAAMERERVSATELPASSAKGIDPDVVKVIRDRLEKLDVLEIIGAYQSAAAGNDAALLVAVNTAHPSAYPRLALALSSNPSIKVEAAAQVRQRIDPAAEKWRQDKEALTDGLSAIIADAE